MAMLLLLLNQQSHAWGFWAHRKANRTAVFTMPPELIGFFKFHIEYITEHAIDPDKRRYASEFEAPRHYIDMDHYGEFPFEDFPRKWKDAVEMYTEDTLNAWGIAPWHIERLMFQLTKAFSEKDEAKILRYATDIGHYIGDLHVPLHTTENYNGQLTGQKGIHGFWESRLPELFGDEYHFFTGRANYIEDPEDWIWGIVLNSHSALDSVLGFEKLLTNSLGEDLKFNYEQRAERTIRTYSREFSTAYHEMLNGQVERRLFRSIKSIGDCWYSCWINAGQPVLDDLRGDGHRFVQRETEKRPTAIPGMRPHQDTGTIPVE